MRVTHLGEYTINQRVGHFKWVNCMVCELKLYKVIFKKSNHESVILPLLGRTQVSHFSV